MNWTVLLHPEFNREFDASELDVQDRISALVGLLKLDGPELGRPYVDSLNGSRHSNMKELRFKGQAGVWRVAFAFDPDRAGLLLIGGNKSGVSQKRFYRQLIARADELFDAYLARLKAKRKEKEK